MKFAHFLGSLHWPCGAGDLGVGGVSFPTLSFSFCMKSVLVREAGCRGCGAFWERVERPISVSAVPLGPGIDIGRWHYQVSCSVTWWVGSVFALSYWCASLPASASGLGKVWAWSDFSSQGDVRPLYFWTFCQRFSATLPGLVVCFWLGSCP